MEFYVNNLSISIEKQFASDIVKNSFPLRYGKCSVIKTPEYEFLFNLNGEIKFIRGLNIKSWPHPAEQLKRTDGNDWVYYSVGDDSSENGIISINDCICIVNCFNNSRIKRKTVALPAMVSTVCKP